MTTTRLSDVAVDESAGGAWVAYYADWSGAAIFDSEVEALRHAVEHHMEVRFVQWGESLR